jgi:hypothetical protein
VPDATFPAEAHAAAEAVLAPDSHVNALRKAIEECPLNDKLLPLRHFLMRTTGMLLGALQDLRENRPLGRRPRRGTKNGPLAAPPSRDAPGVA